MIKFVCLSLLSLGLAACAPRAPCETLCMSTLVEYEPGFEPPAQP
ncbi:hypothetical protein [Paracoccus liaowanqingii]|nr:hypothetical protein [Paracoccus liaowanqingii]